MDSLQGVGPAAPQALVQSAHVVLERREAVRIDHALIKTNVAARPQWKSLDWRGMREEKNNNINLKGIGKTSEYKTHRNKQTKGAINNPFFFSILRGWTHTRAQES